MVHVSTMPTMEEAMRIATVLLTLIVFTALPARIALGDDSHDLYHFWYQDLVRISDNGDCCNGQDCHPTKVRPVGDDYEVLIDGKWYFAPSDRLSRHRGGEGPPGDEPTHGCWYIDSQGSIAIRCIFYPEERSASLTDTPTG